MEFKFANDVTVKNLDMFKKIMDYKHKIGVGDRFWKKTAEKLNKLGSELIKINKQKNKPLKNFEGMTEGEKNIREKKVKEIKELLEGIQKRFDRRNQKFKYDSGVLNPFLKKEIRIRKLMENIMELLEEGKKKKGYGETNDRARQKLFSNQLALKNGLREAYDKAININNSIKKEETKEKIKLDIFKKKLEVLFILYNECFDGEFPKKENLKKTKELENFCTNLKEANNTIKQNLKTKIKEIELNKKSDLLQIYKFIELYNSFIKEVDCQLGEEKIEEIVNKNITNKIIHSELLKIYENIKTLLEELNGLEKENDENTIKNILKKILNYANNNLINMNINTEKLEDGNYKTGINKIIDSLLEIKDHLVKAQSCINSSNSNKINKTKPKIEATKICATYVKTKIESLLNINNSTIEQVN